ncbi:protein TAP1-like [Forsythia ovata]|uniref:Protein TAP1-like n=1 Tax=Forsythia ovata TaxID=205694 RepID=A0ABD1P497_9LAMI
MEAKNVRTITAIMLLMLLLAGQASASFKTCFESCALGCFLAKDKSKCLLKCTIKCVVGINSTVTGLDYCKLGCAVYQCARFGNDVDKVDSCVNECEVGKCSLLSQSKGIASPVSRTPSSPIRAPSPSHQCGHHNWCQLHMQLFRLENCCPGTKQMRSTDLYLSPYDNLA